MVNPVANAGVADTLEACLANARKRTEDGEYGTIPWAIFEFGIRAQWATEHPSHPSSPRPVQNKGGVDDEVDGGARVSGNDGTNQRGVIKVDGGIDRSQARVQRPTVAAGNLRADVDGDVALLYEAVEGCLPESLAPLPRSPAPPCTPCVEGRQRASPHSSFPPTTAPLQTLHLDIWGPSPILGPRQERYFLIVVDDYSRYTMVFPLRRKADVPTVLETWLLARGGARGLCGLRLHSDRGDEFSSTRLETFNQGRGIIQSYTLPDSPQQNGVAERRIGLVMEVAQTSMCHAGAPQFLWPQAVRYDAHQLNLWPRDARPRVTPIFLWTGFPGVAADV
ncbi:unnamed protein product [Closterium sp. NIES-54]